jgi:hypothetical protein
MVMTKLLGVSPDVRPAALRKPVPADEAHTGTRDRALIWVKSGRRKSAYAARLALRELSRKP